MARLLLPLLFSTVALLLPWGAADSAQARCSRPKDVANAHIDVGNNTLLNARLRYVCNPGYKRKAGTSSLIQCILHDGSKPDWTHTTLQCIRDPALPPLTPSPELPTTLHAERMTQRGASDANLTSSPSLAATSTGAAGQPPVPPAPDGSSLETSMAPEVPPPLETSTLGEGTTPLPTAPTHHAAASVQTLTSSIVPLLFVAAVMACCYCRMKMRARQNYTVTVIPMVAPAAENEEMLPPGTFPMG